MKIAFGYRMGAGKDTAVEYLIRTYGGTHISFAGPIYDILTYAQQRCGLDRAKDRQFLQYIGTEWGRKHDPNIWVNLALQTARDTQGNVYISDLRFPNEFEALKKDGWICVKLVRTNPDNRVGTGSSTHVSETTLDNISDHEWDHVIHNDGTLEQFYQALETMVNQMSNSFPINQ